MSDFEFTVIVESAPLTHEQILDATDALGNAGCTDASICGHAAGLALHFGRGADSLQAAISTAIADVERAGFKVLRVELQRELFVVG